MRRRFGEVVALRDVDLDVAAGEVVGLLGPNGAGKTTLLRIVATLLEPDGGQVAVCGTELGVDAAAVRRHLGLAGQYASLDPLLTARENLELVGSLYGIESRDCVQRSAALLESLGLHDVADRRVAAYSGGMRRRLDLGATLIGEPSLLLLDEPTSNLDPRSRIELWDLIDQIAARGSAVLITSQHLDEVERLADRVVVLRNGTVIADDQPRALRRRIGGQVLEIGIDGIAAQTTAEHVLADQGLTLRVDPATSRLTAAAHGLPAAAAAATALTASGIEATDFTLRSPSLEEAFLALTGDASEPTADEEVVGRATLAERTKPTVTHSPLRDIAVITGRYWRHLLRTPQSIFFAAVQPVLFVLGLDAVFGTLVEQQLGTDYIQFLLPGVIVMNLALAAGTTGVGLANDLQQGIIDRFRTLPMTHTAIIIGRTSTDLIRNAVALALMIAAGFAIGFRLDGGLPGGAAALAVALLFGYATTWVFAAVGLAVKDPQAAAFIGFAPVLVFVYLSSAWVPIDTMDGAVQAFARNQPVNVTIESVRGLANGTSPSTQTLQALAWSCALIVAFAALTTWQLRHATHT